MRNDPGTPTRSRLANSPLVEVVFEIRFPGSLQVVSALDRFQVAIRDQFPSLLVPRAEPGDAPWLKPFRFASPDGKELVNVSLNMFSYISKQYSVFAEFRDRFKGVWDLFRKIHDPQKFSRLGLRYVNVLPVPEESRADSPHEWLEFGLRVPEVMRRELSEFQTAARLQFEHGNLRVVMGTGEESTPIGGDKQLAKRFLLDFDFSRSGPIAGEEIFPFLDSAHVTIEETFFSMLSEEAERKLEGKGNV